jgi:glycosyltransferase involved in cell wall biosynthesis
MTTELRILDLGAHDGFVTTWAARQLREHAVTLHVDGVEANAQAVDIANERARSYGLTGKYEIGLAENAADIFEPGTYDAVVAFELIEHVPEVDRFLSVCERMCKPGGRVYLSTPNGTFGAGQNPHHLRVYRLVDLFDLCRRRGEVIDITPGRDGVLVAAYTPTPLACATVERNGGGAPASVLTPVDSRPTCTIHTGAGWEQWDPDDIGTRGLGGSETAAVHLAGALTDSGYAVTVYGEFDGDLLRDQVLYRHHSLFDPLEPVTLAVVSRQPHLFERPLNAARKVLWMHDTDYGDLLTEELAHRMDAIVVLSDWHRAHVEARYPFLCHSNHRSRLLVSRNGIDPSRFPLDRIRPTSERPARAIFSSSPDRGLDVLLRIWPHVRAQVPDAELVYCYGAVYDAVAARNPALAKFRASVSDLTQQDGVTNLGPLDQHSLAGAMAMSRVWLAPSWNGVYDQPFHETYCIGALEAAAAGCRRVMSNWGALTERHAEDPGHSVLLAPVMKQHEDYSRIPAGIDEMFWVAEIVAALQSDDGPGPSEHALSQTWEQVADDIAGHNDAADMVWSSAQMLRESSIWR